jgi:hypothetical protein
MSPLPLPSQTLAWLNHAADAGQRDDQALLHLIARADKHDQDVAKFVDSYSKTIAALCRRLDALERGASLRQRDEDAEATQSDSVADAAQRITDHAAQADLTVQDWAKAFNADSVDDSPVANALRQAESALADVAGGEIGRLCSATKKVTWAKLRCAEALAAIRPVMKGHGIRTSEFPPAAPTPVAPTPSPTAPVGGLVERVANAMGPSTQAAMDAGELPFGNAWSAIREIADWLDTQGHHASANVVRWGIDG